MAVYMATLANGGTRVTPHLLKAVDDRTRAGSGAAAAAAIADRASIRPSCRRFATACGWWSISGGTGGRARIAG